MFQSILANNIYYYSLDFLKSFDLSKPLFIQACRQFQFDETVSSLKNRLNLKKVSQLVSKTYKQNPSTAPGVETLDHRYDRVSGSDSTLIQTVNSGDFSVIFISVNIPFQHRIFGNQEILLNCENVLRFCDEIKTDKLLLIDPHGFVGIVKEYFHLSSFKFSGDPLVINILMDERHADALYQWVKECGVDGNIVEIGRFGGGSTCIFGLAAKQKRREPIYSIDMFTFNTTKYLIERNKLEDHIILLEGKSAEMANQWPKVVEDPSICFLFIDSDHSYQGVVSDIVSWTPYLKKDGFIVFHDVKSLRCPEVTKAVHDYILKNPDYGNFRGEKGVFSELFLAQKIK